tara:strand:+ start:1671 stop:2933 length:1263 start_codon:yes stop_codon:yes gene_type:complete
MKKPKKVTVLGAGIVGVATAYFLARQDCQVTLIDQNPEAGLETSFANGGLITPSMSDPWASPEIPRFILKWMGREDSPFLVRPSALPGLLTWGVKFLRQCSRNSWIRNTQTIFRLCSYSKESLNKVVAETGIDYDANLRGTLHLFRDQGSIDETTRVAETLSEMGMSYNTLDFKGCLDLEPTLASQKDSILGGIHYPEDESGDAHLFSQQLAKYCASIGVEVRYGETIRTLEVKNKQLAAVITDKDRIESDSCVVALGTGSSALLRPFGIRLPIYPVKGYSVTFPVGAWNGAPQVPFADTGRHIGCVRMGSRVRVAGTAEFAGYDKSINPHRIDNLKKYFFELFPDYPDKTAAKAWTGLRPMTPDGIPYLGDTPISGLYLNTGHGHLGWTMSCGSARLIAKIVTGQTTDIDLDAMSLVGR